MSLPSIQGTPLQDMIESVLRQEISPVIRLEYLRRKPLLTPGEVEELFGIRESSLRTWRCRGGGPDYIQHGEKGSVHYDPKSIEKFINRNRIRVN